MRGVRLDFYSEIYVLDNFDMLILNLSDGCKFKISVKNLPDTI